VTELDQYYVYTEDGNLWLGYSETPDDEGTMVDSLGDVANLQDIHDKIKTHREELAGA
jgi:hypothetical protein